MTENFGSKEIVGLCLNSSYKETVGFCVEIFFTCYYLPELAIWVPHGMEMNYRNKRILQKNWKFNFVSDEKEKMNLLNSPLKFHSWKM